MLYKYDENPIHLKDHTITLQSNTNTIKQMIGASATESALTNFDYDAFSYGFPTNAVTFSGISLFPYSAGWRNFIKDSLQFTLQRGLTTLTDANFDVYPVVERANIKLSSESLDWSINFKVYGDINKLKSDDLVITYSDIPLSSPGRLHKWFDCFMTINKNLLGNIPFIYTTVEEEEIILFYMSDLEINYTIEHLEHNIMSFKTLPADIQKQLPVYLPVKIKTEINVSGYTPVTNFVADIDDINNSKLFQYERIVNNDDIKIYVNTPSGPFRLDNDLLGITNNDRVEEEITISPYMLLNTMAFSVQPEKPIRCDIKMTKIFS
jgi:hypothetical protein